VPVPSPVCPLCDGVPWEREAHGGLPVRLCRRCGLGWLARVDDDPYARYRGLDYFRFWPGPDGAAEPAEVERQKRASAERLLDALERATGPAARRLLLEAGCASGDLLLAARDRGFRVRGVELCAPMAERADRRLGGHVVRAAPLDERAAEPGSIDVVVLNDVLEHVPDVDAALAAVARLLAPGGALLVCTPDLDSLSARLLGPLWPHYKPEHLYYFTARSLAALLARHGLHVLRVEPSRKALSPAYLAQHLAVFYPGPLTRAASAAVSRLPALVRYAPLLVPNGNLVLVATA